MNVEVISQKLEDHIGHRIQMDNVINEKLDKIITRQDIANGRVGKLELWRSMLLGAWAIVSILLVSLVIPLFLNYLQTKNEVKAQVNEVLSQYLDKQ